MKKIILFACLCLFTMVNISYGADAMWARHMDAWVEGTWIDHTFVCVNDNGQQDCYAYHGGSGLDLGQYLSGTWGYGDAWKLKTCAANPYECKVVWGVNGVCHQEANRMLYSSGKKVTEADGYWIFYALYSHYGNHPWMWYLCRVVCNY